MKIQKILHKLVSFKSISLKENLSIIDYISSHFKLLGVKPQIIKGEKDIKKSHNYAILRQVFDIASDGRDDWVEDRLYKGQKIE